MPACELGHPHLTLGTAWSQGRQNLVCNFPAGNTGSGVHLQCVPMAMLVVWIPIQIWDLQLQAGHCVDVKTYHEVSHGLKGPCPASTNYTSIRKLATTGLPGRLLVDSSTASVVTRLAAVCGCNAASPDVTQQEHPVSLVILA